MNEWEGPTMDLSQCIKRLREIQNMIELDECPHRNFMGCEVLDSVLVIVKELLNEQNNKQELKEVVDASTCNDRDKMHQGMDPDQKAAADEYIHCLNDYLYACNHGAPHHVLTGKNYVLEMAAEECWLLGLDTKALRAGVEWEAMESINQRTQEIERLREENNWLQKRPSVNGIRQAVNEHCTCRGEGPGDGCPACEIWHMLFTGPNALCPQMETSDG